ncbi:MAG TPA: hypothetical protein DEO83_09055 [Lachnospiraceae bacterium]|nr:hypothetical protein [Lachnospiraceae bacterium]
MAFMIAVSDGYVDVKEVDKINYTFGVTFDYNSLARSYGLDYISDESFMKQIPNSIRTVAEIEKKENPYPNTFLEDTRTLYTAMKEFGNEMLNATGATLKYSVMIQSYFINNVLKYIFRMEELDGLNNSQLNETMTYTKTRLSQNNTTDYMSPDVSSDNSDSEKEVERGGLKLKTQPVQENPQKVNNSVEEPETKAAAENNLESYRGDMTLASDHISKTHTTTIESNAIDMDTIHEILSDVDNLIGLGNVKKEIHDMVNMMLINEMRRRKGLKNPVVSRHLVFTGNPGTGKTTIARAIGKIYKTLGILEKGHMIETDRAGMVAGYMGQTAEKVTEVVQKAMGGILFIDEAYSLVTESEGDFGQEAINTLLKLMEDNRDNLVVIVAGYTEEMQDFINSNPGLRSRFNRYIQFNDYSDDELLQIFKSYVQSQDYILEEGSDDEIKNAIVKIRTEEGENFGNARSMRNYFEKVISNQANRLIDVASAASLDTGEDELMTIKKEDL